MSYEGESRRCGLKRCGPVFLPKKLNSLVSFWLSGSERQFLEAKKDVAAFNEGEERFFFLEEESSYDLSSQVFSSTFQLWAVLPFLLLPFILLGEFGIVVYQITPSTFSFRPGTPLSFP